MVVKNSIIRLLRTAAAAGGEVLRNNFRKEIKVYKKSNIRDIVTAADKEAQDIIVNTIEKKASSCGLKSVGFIAEENFQKPGEYIFVIDPLDGTSNYAAGIDYFCVSIGVIKDNILVAALVYDVMTNDYYWAEKGRGAYKNGERIKVKNGITLQDALVLISFSTDIELRNLGLSYLKKTMPLFRTFRSFGAIALDLCKAASGSGDLVVNIGCRVWDVAAGTLIVREAGGEVVDRSGNDLQCDLINVQRQYEIVAGEKKLLKDILKELKNL